MTRSSGTDRVSARVRDESVELAELLVQLVHRAADIRPVKTGSGGFFLQLFGPPQAGQAFCDGVQRIGDGLVFFFGPLDDLPVLDHVAAAGDLYISEDVRVTC